MLKVLIDHQGSCRTVWIPSAPPYKLYFQNVMSFSREILAHTNMDVGIAWADGQVKAAAEFCGSVSASLLRCRL